MKKITALLLLLSLPRLASAADPDQKEWISLFNGRDLTGWVPKITGYESGVNFGDTFRVEDGVLRSSTTSTTTSADVSATSSTRRSFPTT